MGNIFLLVVLQVYCSLCVVSFTSHNLVLPRSVTVVLLSVAFKVNVLMNLGLFEE